jgi:anti-sigma factor RsiW
MAGGNGDGDGAAPIGPDDLQAWVDGRLPPGRRAGVEAWLAANPEAAARLRRMAAQREALRTALRPKHDEPLPARLRVASLAAVRRRRRRQALRRVAAACAWLGLGGALGWAGHAGLADRAAERPAAAPGAAPRPVAADAIAAHRVFVADAGRPVEVAAAQEAQLVRWLSNRLGRPLVAPDLGPLGYRLMGGRLLPSAAGEPAAQLMYEDAGGTRLTVYLRADRAGGTGTEFRYAGDAAQGVHAFWWVDHGFGYAVSAEGIDRAGLLRAAEAVYRQVLPGGAAAPGRSP